MMSVMRSGSRRSPWNRSIANARAALDFVVNVAEDITLVIRYRAVIPYDNAVAAKSLRLLNAMQSPAQLEAFNAESAADLICRVPQITPDDARYPEWKKFRHLSSARLSPADLRGAAWGAILPRTRAAATQHTRGT